MEAIQQHITFLFRDLPDTDEIKRIKTDLYLNGTDRFDELISQGKSESEALGTVIIEMGDREDLLESFGYNQETDLKDHSLNSLSEARFLIASYNFEGSKIGLGVLTILIGAGLIPTLETFNLAAIGVILLLILVALAVGMFISAGLRLEAIEASLQSAENVFYLTDDDYEIVEEQYLLFKEENRFRIPMGVMLCILSVIPIVYFGFLENEFLIQRYGVILLMLAVGIGVYQFVKYGMNETAYEKVLNLGEYSIEERQLQQKMEPFAGIYWTIITFVYLAWSFLTMHWHYTWIIWPLAGALWAIIVMIYKMMSDREQYRG